MSRVLKKFEGDTIFCPPNLEPATFYLTVRPKPPKKQIGLIATAKRTQKAQQAVCTIGQIVKMGALAFKSTNADLDFSKDPVTSKLKPGDWVVYRHHSGQKQRYGEIKSGDELDELLLLISESDILGQVPQEDVDKFYDWVG